MATTTRTTPLRRLGTRAVIGTGILSLALLAGGAGLAGAATGGTHAAAHATARDSRDRSTERTSKDRSVDKSKDGSSDVAKYDNSGDPQSPDPQIDG